MFKKPLPSVDNLSPWKGSITVALNFAICFSRYPPLGAIFWPGDSCFWMAPQVAGLAPLASNACDKCFGIHEECSDVRRGCARGGSVTINGELQFHVTLKTLKKWGVRCKAVIPGNPGCIPRLCIPWRATASESGLAGMGPLGTGSSHPRRTNPCAP
jgi:hypothetical protein